MINKPRKKWLAAFLTLLTIGLGHIYCGKIKKGVSLFVVQHLLMLFSFFVLKIVPSLIGLAFFTVIIILYVFYCLFDVLKISKENSMSYEIKKYNKWYFYTLIVILSLLIPQPLTSDFIKGNVAQTFKIPSGSMIPTLQIGDWFFAKTDYKSKSEIKRGDLIVFISPKDRSKFFIKRVIATEGETISIKDKKVSINSSVLNEPYIINTDSRVYDHKIFPRDNFQPVKVPEKSLFVMGDHRDNNYDSRFFGFVKKSDVVGKPAFLYWSWDKKNSEIRWGRIGKTLN